MGMCVHCCMRTAVLASISPCSLGSIQSITIADNCATATQLNWPPSMLEGSHALPCLQCFLCSSVSWCPGPALWAFERALCICMLPRLHISYAAAAAASGAVHLHRLGAYWLRRAGGFVEAAGWAVGIAPLLHGDPVLADFAYLCQISRV